jgi:hypothetical protein
MPGDANASRAFGCKLYPVYPFIGPYPFFMKYNLFMSLVVAVLLSMVTSKIVYFGFTPNYAADIFSRKAFNGRFDHDVYKYRILCKYMLFAVDDWLSKDMPERGAEARILINTPGGSERFYLAFYYLNSFFLVLTSIMVVLLLNLERSFQFSLVEKVLILYLTPLLIGLSQFTVCCYDVSSYFFQLLALYVLLRLSARKFWLSIVAVSIIVILSTLNRESAALSVSMAAVILLTRHGWNRKVAVGLGLIAASFLITYITLRFWIVDPTHMSVLNTQAGKIFIDTNFIGLIFWGLFLYLPFVIATTVENKLMICAFFIASVPYVYTCLKDGVLWEIRLFIPLFLGAMFLSKLETSSNVLRISAWTLRMTRRELQ